MIATSSYIGTAEQKGQANGISFTAHANNVIRLVGSPASRMRVGDFRVIFIETEQASTVTRIGPRGGTYD